MDPQFEAVELDGDSVLKFFRVQCATLQDDHAWHYHPECELTYVIQGCGTRFIGDSVQQFDAGDLVFTGPNLPHCWANDTPSDDPQRNQLLVLQFRPDCLGPDFLISPDAQALVELIEFGKRGLRFTGPVVDEATATLRKLGDASGLGRLATFAQLLDQLCATTEVEALTSDIYIHDTRDFHGGRMGTIMRHLKENLAEDIRQSEVAELVGMTPQGFSRFFRATTGRTFVSFVNVLRVMEACRMLINTDDDIVDVAFRCGYANLSNFNRRFAEIKNCTPSEYRSRRRLLVQPEKSAG